MIEVVNSISKERLESYRLSDTNTMSDLFAIYLIKIFVVVSFFLHILIFYAIWRFDSRVLR